MDLTEISAVLFLLLSVFNLLCAVRCSSLRDGEEATEYYYKSLICMLMVNENIIISELNVIKALLTN